MKTNRFILSVLSAVSLATEDRGVRVPGLGGGQGQGTGKGVKEF